MKLKVLKPLSYPRGTYRTRHMQPGDVFEVPYETKKDRVQVALLLKSGKVSAVRLPADVPAPPPAVAEKIADAFAPDALRALRAEYEGVIGRRPFPGWGADKLREMIAAAKAG